MLTYVGGGSSFRKLEGGVESDFALVSFNLNVFYGLEIYKTK